MQHDFILLDRSGSMSSIWAEALSSVNSYVKKLADESVDTGVTVATFDQDEGKTKFEVIRNRITPQTFHPLSAEGDKIFPRGMTPLNDAIGQIVRLANAGPGISLPGYEKVAIIIMTDGQENASREYSTPAAKALLDQCRTKGWQVIMLGADFDNAAQATSYGNAARQTSRVAPGKLGLAANMMGATRAAYATGEAATMDFSDEDKADLSGGADPAAPAEASDAAEA